LGCGSPALLLDRTYSAFGEYRTLRRGCADGGEAIEVIERVRPDVAVLDVEMPVHDGPAVAARLVALGVPTRVLFLSAHRDGATVYDALATGGYGYVTKDSSMRQIQEAVLRVASGVRSIGPEINEKLKRGKGSGCMVGLWSARRRRRGDQPQSARATGRS
jgi:DNA-binding NarL/FixJ family response regulator